MNRRPIPPVFVALLLALVVPACTIRDGKVLFNWGGGSNPAPHVDPNVKHEFRVLIVEDADARATLTGPQRDILTGQAVRDFMKTNCSVGPNGSPEFRVWDAKTDASGESEHWRATLAKPRPSLPWFYVENEKHGTEGPLPEDPDRFLAILKPFADGTAK